jgi:carbonic anhydrase
MMLRLRRSSRVLAVSPFLRFASTIKGEIPRSPISSIFQLDETVERVLSNNQRWVEKSILKDPSFLDKMAAPQKPKIFYIGCSDSRVQANEIMGMEPHEIFVHHNVGNLVANADVNLFACLQYAIEVLNVKHIFVTGQYECGGVQKALKRESAGQMDAWLRNIRDVYRLHHVELDQITDNALKARRLTELNVIEQCLHLYKTDIVQKKRLLTWTDKNEEYAYPRIHGMIFDPKNGQLKALPVNFEEQVNQYNHIYDLYQDCGLGKDHNNPRTENIPVDQEYDINTCNKVEKELMQFCAIATQGRDSSHGVEHMNDVRIISLQIFDEMNTSNVFHSLTMDNTKIRCMIIAAAQLHDVDDHKYVDDDKKGKKYSVIDALCKVNNSYFTEEEAELIVEIM